MSRRGSYFAARVLALVVLAVWAAGPVAAGDDWGADWSDDWSDDWGNGGDTGGPTGRTGSVSTPLDGWSASISGYLEFTGGALFPHHSATDDAVLAMPVALRIRSQFTSGRRFTVTGEMEYRNDPDRLFLDYAYGDLAFHAVDVRLGKQPLAWGSAWAFNPTDRINPRNLSGLAGVEPPGVTAIAPAVALGMRGSIDGYAALPNGSAAPVHEIPFGIRGRFYPGLWDIGAGMVRGVHQENTTPGSAVVRDFLIAEVAGSLGAVNLYGEASLEISSRDHHHEVLSMIDGAAGFRVDLGDHATLQVEYHYRGSDAALRDTADLQDRNYLLAVVTGATRQDIVRVTAAGLANLHDGSMVVLPEVTWIPVDDLELTAGAVVTTATGERNFTRDLPAGATRMFVKATWFF